MPKKVKRSDPTGWWQIRFIVAHEKNQDPPWYVDALLAGEVWLPLLQQFKGEIKLWRVHRVGDTESGGHQCNFNFYCPRKTAGHIYQAAKTASIVKQLKKTKIVLLVKCKDRRKLNPRIEATSAPEWHPYVKKAWPNYGMGLSEMWLNLIEQLKKDTAVSKEEYVDTLLQKYQQIHENVIILWQTQGCHFLMHMAQSILGWEMVHINQPVFQFIKF
jgi:hypothetical protein